ncbi:uncharacterized protein LOC122623956 [Drosophila teissieri]|uniref:uncharacterized protein LOC122623956 n=1 Tax=Drosophila teissieri TaxID=7243 RepID=UPI001CBA3044|nr:uncharacterized protein LOC122623956 [Drosophila teissieri]
MTTSNTLMLKPDGVVSTTMRNARRRRRVLRRLLENRRAEDRVANFHFTCGGDQKKTPLRSWVFLILAIAAGASLTLRLTNLSTVGGFLENYKNQYHSIVHNQDNYCNPSQRLGNMVQHARHQVLNQNQALDQLELALDSTAKKTIVLVGTSGVGKSHTARILRENFPWSENVKTHSWSGYRSLRLLKSMLSDLTVCGQNMILIDNMTPKDAQFVPAINQLISMGKDIANHTEHPHQKLLTVVLIFNVNSMQSSKAFKMDMETLRNLPYTHVITYATLESTHLFDCIRREAAIAMVQLEDEHVDEIIRSIDATASGCKSILAKVLLYGKPIIADSQGTDQDHPTD